jgi:N6-L-threonylcarbamoyladenine synthase
MSFFLGFDTSNYTTSAAVYDDGKDMMFAVRKLLDVEPGKIGLRQRDAVFIHTRNMPGLINELLLQTGKVQFDAAAASEKPREAEGSYMPCFLVGVSHAKAVAFTMGVPYFGFTHQQGHLAAGAWSAGRMDLLDGPFIALHVSGGTTELLYVEPADDMLITAGRIGGTTDLAAGQLVDRCGQMLGLGFPAGPEIEKLALKRTEEKYFVPKLKGLEFSLSGLENKVNRMLDLKESASNIAYFVIKSITEALCSAIEEALSIHPGIPVLCAGGVMSNSIIRKEIEGRYNAVFAQPSYASDNAAGIALLAARAFRKGVDAVAAK